MGKFRKCIICGELIDDGTDTLYKPRQYVHKKCFNVAVKTLQTEQEKKQKEGRKKKKAEPKPKAELKDAVSEEEYKDKKEFYDYLRGLGVEPNPKIYTLVNKYQSQFNCTFKGLLSTLMYVNEILQKELTGDAVGIIPYYYNEALNYYKNIQKIESNNADLKPEYKTHVIKIKRPSSTRRKEIPLDDV